MKVKKFKGKNMPEVMQVVRKELGNDAVILNSKEIQDGGFLGLFKQRKIEVLAAIDPAANKVAPVREEQPKAAERQRSSFDATSNQDQEAVLKEIKDMKRWIQQNTAQQQKYEYPFQLIYDHLIEKEVHPEVIDRVIQGVQSTNSFDDPIQVDTEELWQSVKHQFKKEMRQSGTFGGSLFEQQFVHFVGPTGVGKTTTIAKLAAYCSLHEKKSVAFITTDTYRIAAIEQLKTYSKILDVPLEIAYDLNDYQKARQKFQNYDIVLVDTAGRNFKDKKYVEELSQQMDLAHDVDTYLVLSLTTRAQDLEEIYQQFDNVPLKQIIFTKKDETSTFGALANLCLTYGIGIAYLTNGQDVPDDIEEATIDHTVEMIVGD
ncbi:flagellar biosynthesis regulator FlhF [Gracilibacillus halophilus YIM-C55.5]|uniref:Flagellar biosynthesis protein FlhF n=1 Tax=Gracilibacillus halophilus YIM-C55.5 TaxID=1308866 RepID=N4WYU4_9BACI|nr:flagellar biosynthesis protein FlhF [Gracilibacillus halophilus]ENH98221.1 flagellar biosynthesis regulator FlhF [Gracilibacillus halophilus YIM-C55.5]